MTAHSVAADVKDSGVAWLGRIPASWTVVGAKRLFAQRNQRAATDDAQLTASQAYGVIPQDEFMAREARRVVQVIKDPTILKHVEPGDFVISMRSFQGGIERSDHRGSVSSAYVVLRPLAGAHRPYFTYLLKSASYIQALQSTSDLVRDGQALRYENFALLRLPSVPLAAQKAIARYLDSEVARVDALIHRKQRFIDLLLEKRTALITQSVTKGLDPTFETMNTGDMWLGSVPSHWTVQRLGQLLSPRGYKAGPFGGALKLDTLTSSGELKVYAPEYLIKRRRRLEDEYYLTPGTEAQYRQFRLVPGDVMISIVGSVLHGTVFDDSFEPGILNQRLARLHPHPRKIRAEYLALVLGGAPVYVDGIRARSKGAILEHITRDQVMSVAVALPPLVEQDAILRYIAQETGKIQALCSKTQGSIDLLREYRTALISSAATGQIDIPGTETSEDVA